MADKKMTKKILALLLALAMALTCAACGEQEASETTVPQTEAPRQAAADQPQEESAGVTLTEGLDLIEAASYTGFFLEDGSDEVVTGVLMIVVKNTSAEPIQYAEIQMDVEGETAQFSVTALPAGEEAVLLERNRMPYKAEVDYLSAPAECTSLAVFSGELSLHEDKLKIQPLDGALNITNISSAEITDTITLCYKGYQNGQYYGGIAYRIRLEGGLKAGELRQIMAEHFQEPGSKLVFVELTK